MSTVNIRLEPIIDDQYQQMLVTKWLPKLMEMSDGTDWTEQYLELISKTPLHEEVSEQYDPDKESIIPQSYRLYSDLKKLK